MNTGKNLVIAIYSHPEYYPPTLNALEFLSKNYDTIYIVHRNITGFDWKFPSNVKLLHSGVAVDVRDAERLSAFKKIQAYWSYSQLLSRTIRSSGAKTLLIYDYLPWLAYRLFKMRFPRNLLLWYHNHDVAEAQYIRKGTISWWAWKSEQKMFPRVDIFSLPSVERKACFPMERFNGRFFFLPNYPSVSVYRQYGRQHKELAGPFRILFQGSIGPLHGLEEIIPLLAKKVAGKSLQLVLKGFIGNEYRNDLLKLAAAHNVEDKLIFVPPTGYQEVIRNAQSCHIGIGIHKKQDIMNKTLGTASNKIYEYAASGMPVLLYDNEHFRATLGNRPWVFFTDTSAGSLLHCLEQAIAQYPAVSAAARHDFETELCFEHHFTPLMDYLSGKNNLPAGKQAS